jgi:hypothetical protein
MKRKTKLLAGICLSIIILLSCAKQPDADMGELENQFSNLLPLADMNKSLQIAVSTQEKSFKSGSEIELTVYNKSPHSFYFDNDTHVRLLGSSDNLLWTEVENAITYSATMILSPKGTTLLDTQPTWVKPILDQSVFDAKKGNVLLRIAIVGEIMDGEIRTGKQVGAYIDVVLTP